MSKEYHASDKSPVKKSAFAPIRPSAGAIERVKTAAAAEVKAKPELPAAKVRLPIAGKSKEVVLPAHVQIWDEVVSRPDRSVFGWSYITNRSASIAAIGIAINIEHWLVKRALLTQDAPHIAYLLGMSLGEALTYRSRSTPWIPALLEQLREAMFKDQDEGLRVLVGVQFLGGQLAQTAAFKKASADLLAPGGAEPGKKHLIGTVSLGKEGGES
jgi:hypothetical protein